MFSSFEYRRKARKYSNLASKIGDFIQWHDFHTSDATASFNQYRSSLPNLPMNKIPADDFEIKRVELTNELQKYLEMEKEKRRELVIAQSQAQSRSSYYSQLAEAEEARERARAEAETKANKK